MIIYERPTKDDSKDREIIKLKANVLSLEQQNKLLHEKYGTIKSRHEIIRELKYLIKVPAGGNMKIYEEGQIKALLFVLGYPEGTKLEEIKEEI